MTTIEKLERLLRERNAYLQHITETGDYGISFDGYHRRYRSGESLEDVINKAYDFAFWVRKVQIGEIVRADTPRRKGAILLKCAPESESHGPTYSEGDLSWWKPTILRNVTIIGKTYDEPIPVESAE